ncbi:hypothetical protein ABKN59_001506 [Abortiporus biennis]
MSSPPAHDLIGGPVLIGFAFNWALLGVLTAQLYMYHISFPEDHLGVKTIVYTLYLLDLAQTFIISSQIFENFILMFGNPDSFQAFSSSWISLTLMSGIVATIVQCIYAWRISQLAHSYVISAAIVVLSLLQGSSSIATGIGLRNAVQIHAVPHNVLATALLWLASSAVNDVLIAATMVFLLWRMRITSSPNFPLVNQLIIFSIETGSVTAAVSIVTIILFSVFPNTLLHVCPVITLAKLYTNSLLAGLNNRALIHDEFRSHIQTSGSNARPVVHVHSPLVFREVTQMTTENETSTHQIQTRFRDTMVSERTSSGGSEESNQLRMKET